MTIKKKLVVLFSIPLAALAITAMIGFRSQSVESEVIEDAIQSAAMTSALNDFALAAGAERLPSGAIPDVEPEELQEQTDLALEAVAAASRFSGITIDTEGWAAQVEAARAGDPVAWDGVIAAAVDTVNAVPTDSQSALAATASIANRSASGGLVAQEAVWFDVLALPDGEIAPSMMADFAVARTLLTAAAAEPFADDPFGGALRSDAQLRLNELAALAAEDVAQGTTADLDSAEVIGNLAAARATWAVAIDRADDVIRQDLVERNDAIVDARSLYLLLAAVSAVLLAALLFVTGRSILRPLNGLIDEADTVATVRLPKVVNHLRALGSSDEIPPMPPIKKHSDDEVGALVDAFNEVQGTAVLLATEQAQSRRNVAEMFVNLGRRNQQLNHRMLSMLSDLEQNEKDPETLANLYKLDHLATRMRRNAESLLVLAGNQTPRQWAKPVTVERAVRSALGEIEGWERVEVGEMPDVSLPGSLVADVTHLLAELLENAINFSDPSTTVELSAWRMREGMVLRVADAGIGIGASDLIELNERISTPPRLDQAPSRLLGLFVVGRLADRHDLRVVLESEPGMGTTAQIALPAEMLIIHEEPAAEPTPEPEVAAPIASTEIVEATAISEAAAPAVSEAPPVVSSPPLPPGIPSSNTTPISIPAPPTVIAPADLPAPPPVPAGAEPLGGSLPTRTPQQAYAEQMPEPLVPLAETAAPTAPAPEATDSGFGSLVAFVGGVNRGLDEIEPTERTTP